MSEHDDEVEFHLSSKQIDRCGSAHKEFGTTVGLMRALPARGDCMPYIKIPSGYFAIVSKFGQTIDCDGSPIWPEGFHWAGIATKVDFLIAKQSIFFDIPVRDVATSDNIKVSVNTAIVFKVSGEDPELVKNFALDMTPNQLELQLSASVNDIVKHAAMNVKHTEIYSLCGEPNYEVSEDDTEEKYFPEDGGYKGPSLLDTIKEKLIDEYSPIGLDIEEVLIKKLTLPDEAQEILEDMAKADSKAAEDKVIALNKMTKQNHQDEIDKIEQTINSDALATKAKLEKIYTDKKTQLNNAKALGDKDCAMLRRQMLSSVEMTEAKTEALVSKSELNVMATLAEFECLAHNDATKLETSIKAAIDTQLAEARLEAARLDAQTSMLISNAEGEIAKMVAVRKEHETAVKKLEVYRALAMNEDMIIVPGQDTDVSQLLIADEILKRNDRAGHNETRSTFLAEMVAMQKANKVLNLHTHDSSAKD